MALLLPALMAGCQAECRKLEPLDEVQAEMRERIDDGLDDIDATDVQRAKIQRVFAATAPARARFRQESVPLLHELVTELRRQEVDRQRAGALIAQLVDAGERYAQVVADCIFKSHAVLTAEQRIKLANVFAKPSEAFDGSWFLDRAIDYLMLRIEATQPQQVLVARMKSHFVRRARELQHKLDVGKVQAAAEFRKPVPDLERVHANLHASRAEVERFALDVAGYHQLLLSKLAPKQRALLAAEVVRIEVCREPASKQRHGRLEVPPRFRPDGALGQSGGEGMSCQSVVFPDGDFSTLRGKGGLERGLGPL